MSPAQARTDFARIREDGFNAVILVVPWRGFQVDPFPTRYENHYFKLLRALITEAGRARLWIILRVSYSHHICDAAGMISADLTARFLTDEAYQKPWLHYLRRVRRATRFAANIYGAFLCWEEFWHGLMRFCEEPEEQRQALADSTGFTQFLGAGSAVIPRVDDPGFKKYHEFIDIRLGEIVEIGRRAFPGLGYEFRVDKDPLRDADGSVSWMSNNNYADSGHMRYSYWAPFIGAANQGESLSADEALALLEYNLREQAGDAGNVRQIIDQFNFVDDTFKYSGLNARLAETEIMPFLARCEELLPRYSRGIGIWAWRDYYQNHLFNPGFQLGLQGWDVRNTESTAPGRGGEGLRLTAGDEIGQSFRSATHGMHQKFRTSHLELRVKAAQAPDLQLETSLDGESYFPLLWDAGEDCYWASLPIDDLLYAERGVLFRLRVLAGSTHVRMVNLYQYAYRVGIRDTDGQPGPLLEPLRRLNRGLAAT
jgi:hypothetical protein